jgi:hypothetical protein
VIYYDAIKKVTLELIDPQSQPQPQATFEDTLRADTEKAARRTLRHKFGRLSNRRILSVLRSAADAHVYEQQPDEELLDRWFAEYEAALRRLRAQSASQAG